MADDLNAAGLHEDSDPAFLALIEKYLSGEACDEDVEKLGLGLTASAENRELLVRLASLSGLMAEHFALSRAHADVERALSEVVASGLISDPWAPAGLVAEGKEATRAAKTDPSAVRPPNAASPVLGFLGSIGRYASRSDTRVVGSLVLFVVVAAFLGLYVQISRTRNPVDDVARQDFAVAHISDLGTAKWSGGETAKTQDSPVRSGELLKIDAGLVELKLKQGTTLLIEGPAEWTVSGDNNATLKRGRLVANVPKRAVGFTLETPFAKIIDRGTEFGVEVTSSGDSAVCVFEGKVDFLAIDDSRSPGQAVQLTAGESHRATRRSGKVYLAKGAVQPESFARTLVQRDSGNAIAGVSAQELFKEAIAYWEFTKFETIGSGRNSRDRNDTGTRNDIADLNGGESWLTRHLADADDELISSGTVQQIASEELPSTDGFAFSANSDGWLLRDLSGSGEELIPKPKTSYTVFVRVFTPQFDGIDDVFRVGDWLDPRIDFYALQTSHGRARFITRGVGGSREQVIEHRTPLAANHWYDLTGVFNSAERTMSLYVFDPVARRQVGSVVTSQELRYSSLEPGSADTEASSFTRNIAPFTRNLLIFTTSENRNGPNNRAKMDLAAVWDRAFTAAEITSLSQNLKEVGP